jgi:hypothetical protein
LDGSDLKELLASEQGFLFHDKAPDLNTPPEGVFHLDSQLLFV